MKQHVGGLHSGREEVKEGMKEGRKEGEDEGDITLPDLEGQRSRRNLRILIGWWKSMGSSLSLCSINTGPKQMARFCVVILFRSD